MSLTMRPAAALIAILAFSIGAAFVGGLAPTLVGAQAYSAPLGHIVITTQTGVNTPSTFFNGSVTVAAAGPSLSGSPSSIGTLTYASNFENDTKVVTVVAGSYAVTAAPSPNYGVSYSTGCTGTVSAGSTAVCTIIASPYTPSAATLTVRTNVTSTRDGAPSSTNFQIHVSGQSPSPSLFAGSSAGTVVALGAGSFTVTAPALGGYTPSLSGACSGTIQAGQALTCTVTYSDADYNSYPGQGLVCTPPSQTAALGQTVTFRAYGGQGAYTWITADRTYVNIGPTLTTSLQSAGAQSVIVSSGNQTALCALNVSGVYAYAGAGYANGYNGGYVLGAYTSAPGLPNTGFEPIDWMGMLLGILAVFGAAAYMYRYGSSKLSFLVG